MKVSVNSFETIEYVLHYFMFINTTNSKHGRTLCIQLSMDFKFLFKMYEMKLRIVRVKLGFNCCSHC